MALTEIDGSRQIQDLSIGAGKLLADFLGGTNLNLTDSNNDATLSGLANGTANNDAVNKGQMDTAIASALSGAMSYVGTIDASVAAGTALDGASIGDFFLVSVAGTLDSIVFSIGDHLVVNAAITDFSVDGAGKIDIIDNTEASDILRTSNIINDIVTGGVSDVLSAQQGVVLKGLIDGVAADLAERVYSETPTVTNGAAVLPALANIPVDAGTARVYLNGMRQFVGAGNDYLINETTGVITFNFNLKTKDFAIVDYRY